MDGFGLKTDCEASGLVCTDSQEGADCEAQQACGDVPDSGRCVGTVLEWCDSAADVIRSWDCSGGGASCSCGHDGTVAPGTTPPPIKNSWGLTKIKHLSKCLVKKTPRT